MRGRERGITPALLLGLGLVQKWEWGGERWWGPWGLRAWPTEEGRASMAGVVV